MKVSLSMGRPRQDMVDVVKSCQDVVQEHIWKLYAYHKIRTGDVAGWIETLNKYLPKLATYNIQKRAPNKKNVDRTFLEDKFVTELFEDDDIHLQNRLWANKGFPEIPMDTEQCEAVRKLAVRFVDCIVEQRVFKALPDDLY